MTILAALTLLLGLLPASALATASESAPTPTSTPSSVPDEKSDQSPPVVVVLDLSGSMNDDDGTGLIKLTGAKKAVSNVIQGMPSSQPFGLWTYPGGSDDCSSGSFTIPPAPISDLTGTIAKVDALTADGGTPTGPALSNTADTLASIGVTTATLVLVSDGESNCGQAPCEVAAQLAPEGFGITIHSVGFRVSQQGRDELNCVASATGGTYVDVNDSEQLAEKLHELTRARLRVQTSRDLNATTGLATRITVTVTNGSAVTASDVQLLLQIEGVTPLGVIPVLKVGNLRPGTSILRTWTVGSNALGGGAKLTNNNTRARKPFSVAAWAANADRVTAEGTLSSEVTDSGEVSMRDDLADWVREPLDDGYPLVILGDSFSSSEGTFDYVDPPAGVSPDCHRSNKTYLIPQLEQGEVVNLACSGAVSWDFYYPSERSTRSQLQQLSTLAEAPGAAIMTLGGNDIGFEKIVTQCVASSCDTDATQIAAWKNRADSLRVWLSPVYQDVWNTINLTDRRTQRGGAYAPVIVLAYPQLTHATKYGACGDLVAGIPTFGAGEVKVANDLVARLNAAIKAAVADARSVGYEVYYVADTADFTLPDRTLCAGGSGYINDVFIKNYLTQDAKPESIHPKLTGYAVETSAIVRWTHTVTVQPPSGVEATAVASPPWMLAAFGTPNLDLSKTSIVDGTLFSGGPLRIISTGYEPGAAVAIVINSTTAVLATLVADENGKIDGQVRVPAAIGLGQHEIVVGGIGNDGVYNEQRVTVSVLAPPPLWVQATLPAAVLLLVGASVFALLLWRTRRSSP